MQDIGPHLNKNGVYCLTFVNGKRYVGVGIAKNGRGIKQRIFSYRSCSCCDQPKLYNALKKYGTGGFTASVTLETSDRTRAFALECQLIALWGLQQSKNGYNITRGGDGITGVAGKKWSEARKLAHGEYLRNWWKTHQHPSLGTKQSSHTIEKRLLSRKDKLPVLLKGLRLGWQSRCKKHIRGPDGLIFKSQAAAAGSSGVSRQAVWTSVKSSKPTKQGIWFRIYTGSRSPGDTDSVFLEN